MSVNGACTTYIHIAHMYCTVKQTENTFLKKRLLSRKPLHCLCLFRGQMHVSVILEGPLLFMNSFMGVSWQPRGFMFLTEPSLQRHNSFDCTKFTLWWIAAEFGLSFYLMPVHTYQVSLLRERREERDMANATVHRNSGSPLFDNQR